MNLHLEGGPDYYLVLAGPEAAATSSRGRARPWLIEAVFLFEAQTLLDALKHRGVKIGIATSVARQYWSEAQICPMSGNSPFALTVEQREALSLFGAQEPRG